MVLGLQRLLGKFINVNGIIYPRLAFRPFIMQIARYISLVLSDPSLAFHLFIAGLDFENSRVIVLHQNFTIMIHVLSVSLPLSFPVSNPEWNISHRLHRVIRDDYNRLRIVLSLVASIFVCGDLVILIATRATSARCSRRCFYFPLKNSNE